MMLDFRLVPCSVNVLRVDDELNGRPSAAVRNLQLLRRRAVSGHPLRRFGPGSLKTLLPRGQVRQDLAELGTVSWIMVQIFV